MLTVTICHFSRNEPDLRSRGLEDGDRSVKSWPASISNKRRRRKKARKTKARDSDVTINLESEEIEEVEIFEEDVAPLRVVDVPKVSGLCRIFLCLATRCDVQATALSTFNFFLPLYFFLPVLPVPHHILCAFYL